MAVMSEWLLLKWHCKAASERLGFGLGFLGRSKDLWAYLSFVVVAFGWALRR